MADVQEHQAGDEAQSGRPPEQQDKQAWLIKLAERTVLQAETLAQEITDRARQESEVEGAKLLEQYTAEAKKEARRIVEAAEQQCLNLNQEATAKAQSKSEELLGKAQKQSQEILGKAQREAAAVINASNARIESRESNVRLKTEFIIRQLGQNLADSIRHAVMETCNTTLPALDQLGKEVLEQPATDSNDLDATLEKELLEKALSNGTESDTRPASEVGDGSGLQPSANATAKKKARSSASHEGQTSVTR